METKFTYKHNEWDVILPSIKAYQFQSIELDNFLDGVSPVPFVFDTNLVRPCNVNCKYCSTFGGKSDLRFEDKTNNFPVLNDKNLEDIIKQLSKNGLKTIFLCSNGEPLLNINSFLKIAEVANENGLNTITYTNGTTLTKSTLKSLLKNNVNLVIKLESLNSKINDDIISNKKTKYKKTNFEYKYTHFNDAQIPVNIYDALDVYSSNRDMLAIETMIIKDNLNEIIDLREWIYNNLQISQFLKRVYNLGYINLFGYEIKPDEIEENLLIKKIIELDTSFGFKYPVHKIPDEYSFDVRRFLNNVKNKMGTPLRMFFHEKGGVYHSSQITQRQFGFDTNLIMPIKTQSNEIEMYNYLMKIQDKINE